MTVDPSILYLNIHPFLFSLQIHPSIIHFYSIHPLFIPSIHSIIHPLCIASIQPPILSQLTLTSICISLVCGRKPEYTAPQIKFSEKNSPVHFKLNLDNIHKASQLFSRLTKWCCLFSGGGGFQSTGGGRLDVLWCLLLFFSSKKDVF